MLADVGHCCGLNLLRQGVLANERGHLGVLHASHVNSNVGLVVLLDKRLDRLAVDQVHVLLHGVHRFLVVLDRHQLVGVLDAQHVQHLTVQERQVVNLRGHLRELNDRLVLHHALRQCGCVGVRDGDDLDMAEVRLACVRLGVLDLVVVRVVRVVAHDGREHLEFLLEREVHTGLNGRHHLEGPLQNGQRGAHRCIGRHVGDLCVRRRGKATAFLDDLVHEAGQNHRRLFVRQRQDVVAD